MQGHRALIRRTIIPEWWRDSGKRSVTEELGSRWDRSDVTRFVASTEHQYCLIGQTLTLHMTGSSKGIPVTAIHKFLQTFQAHRDAYSFASVRHGRAGKSPGHRPQIALIFTRSSRRRTVAVPKSARLVSPVSMLEYQPRCMACHVRAVDPAVPGWDLVPVHTP